MQLGWLLKRFARAKLITKLYVILILPASVLLFYTLSHLNYHSQQQREIVAAQAWLEASDSLDFLIFSLQAERGLSAINSSVNGNTHTMKTRLSSARVATDQALSHFLQQMKRDSFASYTKTKTYQYFTQDIERLPIVRKAVEQQAENAEDVVLDYRLQIERLMRMSSQLHLRIQQYLGQRVSLQGDLELLTMIESLGLQRAIIAMDLATQGHLSLSTIKEVERLHRQFANYFSVIDEVTSQAFAQEILNSLNSPVSKLKKEFHSQLLQANSEFEPLLKVDEWWDVATSEIDQLSLVQHSYKLQLNERLDALKSELDFRLVASVLFAVIALLLSLFSLFWMRRNFVDSVVEVQTQLADFSQGAEGLKRLQIEGAYEIQQISRSVNQLLEQLEHSQDELLLKSRHSVMGEMIGMIAHQWRQPLTVVTGVMDVIDMQIEASQLSDADKKQFKTLAADAFVMLDEMNRTIDDFKHFNNPNKEQTEFNVQTVVDFAVKMSQTLAMDNQVNLLVKGHGFYVTGMERELLQVILNLLKNAIEQHAVHTTEQKWVRVTLQPGMLGEKQIIVEDNAGGIPAVVMKNLFDAYFSTKSLNGTGLGLYMSKMIIENSFNGQMRAENTDEGARFILTFPEARMTSLAIKK